MPILFAELKYLRSFSRLIGIAWAAFVCTSVFASEPNQLNELNASTNHLIAKTNQPANSQKLEKRAEEIRSACIEGRRQICGRVLAIVSEGLVVESGYTNLLRPELGGKWLVRANVSVASSSALVEAKSPGAVCVGTILINQVPRKPPVKVNDYIVLEGYPAGEYIYTPVPSVQKSIRRFSARLAAAVQLNLHAEAERATMPLKN